MIECQLGVKGGITGNARGSLSVRTIFLCLPGTPEKQVTVIPSRQKKNSPRASPKPRSSPRIQSLQQENGLRSTQIALALNPTLAMSNAQIQNTGVVTSAMTHPLQLAAGPGIPVVSYRSDS